MKTLTRLAALKDLPFILAIYNDAALKTTATADTHPATLEQRREWLEFRQANGYPVLVAETETGEIIGWSSLSPYHSRYGYRFTAEVSVYVAEEWRGQGIGKLLVGSLIASASPGRYHSLLASVDAENKASLRLHGSLGFVQTGVLNEVVFKFDRWLDVVFLQRMMETGEQKDQEGSELRV